MKKIDFNGEWLYRHLNTDDDWVPVTLPHDAMLHESRSTKNLSGKNGAWFAGWDYEYIKTFSLPDTYRQKQLVFEFESVYHDAEIYINGTKIAEYNYGYSSIYVKLPIEENHILNFSNQLNEIRVIAHNAEQPNNRWYSGAGIYRPAWLYVMDAEHIELNGIKIHTTKIDPPEIVVDIATNTKGSLTIEILDNEKCLEKQQLQTTGKATQKIELPTAILWEPGTPKLYTCRITFGNDVMEESFGIRMVGWDALNGFTINEKRVILRGACIHHDNGLLGACTYPEVEERRVRLLMETGYNAIRSAHNPCSKSLLEACDRLGMLVLDEYTDVWYIHKTRYDYALHMADCWQSDLKDLVNKDYNHPSVIMYSTGNEVSETAQPRGIELTSDMTKYLHELDSTRPVTCGINIFFNFLSSIGLGVYSDDKSEKEVENAEKSQENSQKAVGSEFYNNLAGHFGKDFMKFGATLHGSDVKTRNAFERMDIAGYNYGINRYSKDLKKYPERLILGTETFCSDAAKYLQLAEENNRIIGDFVWAGMDYIGETGVGAWEYLDYVSASSDKSGWLTAGSGRLDILGRPLGEAGYTRIVYGVQTNPVIAVRPVNHTGEKHTPSAWKMTNAIESWGWNGCEGRPAIVEVYTKAPYAQLFINGKSVGKAKVGKNCRKIFKTTFQQGTIAVEVYDESGNKVGQSQLQSDENTTMLRAIPEKIDVAPGELCYVLLQYTDAKGVRKPMQRGTLQLQVSGGELVAAGHACPYNPQGYLNNFTDTYYGEAMAIVRAAQSGIIKITASDNEYTCSAEIKCTTP